MPASPAGGPVEEKAVEALAMERYAASASDLIGPQREALQKQARAVLAALSIPDLEALMVERDCAVETTLDDARRVLADMRAKQEIPVAEFPGHKGIYLANLEGVLGQRMIQLLNALDQDPAAGVVAEERER